MEESNRQRKMRERLEKMRREKEKEEMNFTGKALRIGGKEDPPEVRIPGQQWYLFSFVAPSGSRQRGKAVFVKFRGAFATDKEAEEHAKKMHEVDPDFDIHIFKANNWIQVPPPAEHYESVPMKYNQDKLDKIMDDYYSQQKKKEADLAARVRDAKRQAAKKNKAIQGKLDEARKVREGLGHVSSEQNLKSEETKNERGSTVQERRERVDSIGQPN